MADEGVRFTSFYAAPYCGPSRASLLTGCYPPRVSLAFNHGPNAKTGIHPDEITLPEILKKQGYATMHIGKWHLGDHPRFLPRRHGFDSFFGLPYSNDMWPYHPKMPVTENEDAWMIAARLARRQARPVRPGQRCLRDPRRTRAKALHSIDRCGLRAGYSLRVHVPG